jgi:hypothetical protein
MDPIIDYRRQLPSLLAEQVELFPLEEDIRTPEIQTELAALGQKISDLECRERAERDALMVMEADYSGVLLGDRQAAAKLKAAILTAGDVLSYLSAELGRLTSERQQLEAGKAQIAQARAGIEQSNEIAESINAAKARAKAMIDFMTTGLPELREIYRLMMERSLDYSLPEFERARLQQAADVIEQNFREFVVFQLDGNERTRAYTFLRVWVDVPQMPQI